MGCDFRGKYLPPPTARSSDEALDRYIETDTMGTQPAYRIGAHATHLLTMPSHHITLRTHHTHAHRHIILITYHIYIPHYIIISHISYIISIYSYIILHIHILIYHIHLSIHHLYTPPCTGIPNIRRSSCLEERLAAIR